MQQLKEALIGKHNASNASTGIQWITPTSPKELVPGRVVKLKDTWGDVLDYICFAKRSERSGIEGIPWIDIEIMLRPANNKSGSYWHYTDDFKLYNNELKRGSSDGDTIIQISKDLIDISKVKSINDLKKIFKKYNLNYI